jgi:AcrR family transcriptional regulator
MGNREALLRAAKDCLLRKGFARTTARDIASIAQVSLAAIGYHFASKEALLTEALMLAIEDWEKQFRHALHAEVRISASPAKRFEIIWTRLIETFETHRSLWVANFEIFSQMDRLPEIRRVLGNSLQGARSGLAALFLNVEEGSIDEHTARTAGAFYHALMSGLIAQWLIEPQHALSARDLTEVMHGIALGMLPTDKTSVAKSKRTPDVKPKRTKKKPLV